MRRLALALALLLVAARAASAAPLLDLDVGGMVFVGPTSAHPTAIYWNPAAGGLQRGFHVWWSGAARFDYLDIGRASIDTGNGEPDENPVGTPIKRFDPVTTTTLAPGSYIGLIYDFNNEKITGGVAFYTPHYDRSPGGHDALRYHTRGHTLRTLAGTAAFSYRPWRYLIFGAGVNLLVADMHLGFSLDGASLDSTQGGLESCEAAPCDVENPQYTSDYSLDASTGYAPEIGFTFGTLYLPSPNLKLALVYHSSPGLDKLALTGTAEVTPAPLVGGGAVRGDAQIYLSLPQSLQLGLAWDVVPARLQLVASVTWIDLSVGSELDLRMAGPELRGAGVREWVLRYRGLRDVFVFDVGLERPADDTLRLGARLRVETGATSNSHISPQQVDGPSATLLGGLETGLGGGLALTVSVRAGAMLPATVDDSAFKPSEQTSCVASGFDLDQCVAAREGRAIPTAAGDYLHFNYGFMLGLAYDRL